MIPQIILDNLNATGVFGQVAAAPLAKQTYTLSTANELVALLDPAFQQRVFAVSMGSNTVHPSVVYQLASVQIIKSSGYALAQVDRYQLQAYATTYSSLQTAVDQAIDDIAASIHGIEVVDMLMAFDTTSSLYRCDIELVHTTPANGGALPAAFVVPVSWEWQSSEYGNSERQTATGQYSVAILSTGGDLQNLEISAREALQGAQQDINHAPLELYTSEPTESPGGLMIWQLTVSQDHVEGE